jgi:hypothetical protein
MTFNAARYRTYLEDARKRAEQASDPVEKRAWLRMAEKWFKLLALAAARREGGVGDSQSGSASIGYLPVSTSWLSGDLGQRK